MAVLESRQVVAWTVPTVALLVSLLWLRRRYRSRDPPTSDPGGFQSSFVASTPAPPSLRLPEECSVSPIRPEEELSSLSAEEDEEEESPGVVFKSEVEVENLSFERGFVEFSVTHSDLEAAPKISLDLHNQNIGSSLIDVETETLETVGAEESIIQEFVSGQESDIESKEVSSVNVPNKTYEKEQLTTDNLCSLDCEVTSDVVDSFKLDSEENSFPPKVEKRESPVTILDLDKIQDLEPQKEVAASVNSIQEEASTMEKGVLEEKLASLVLDTMKLDDGGKQNAERDSANQSPSEVMLASPSISNFSDAHSEGSSDSGKGHSDVATSPSRTPAGGSSLAGDSAFSIYEFVLPQFMVGRLIGRHGSFIHEIRTSTHTNIFIKRHPDTSKLKICAIEGTQQDIDKALAKIRQKFPIRRFPKLTLEKVSFISVNNPPPLKPEDFHLTLVEGVNNDVILSSLISAAHFFLQQPSHPTYSALCRLNQVMNTVYSNSDAPVLETPVKDAICAAPTMGGWYRAQIVTIDEENQKCDVRFVDYGGYLTLDSSYLRQIRADLLMLPFQAVECYLANVVPAGGEEEDWTEEARLVVQSLTHGQLLQAQIYDYAEDGTPLVYLYSTLGSQIILINEELVARGFATIVTPAEE